MFFLLLSSFRHKQVGDIPVESLRCGANFNGTLYDVSAIANLNLTFEFSDDTMDYTYYIRLCDDLNKDDVPFVNEMQFGVNGIRINTQTNFTEPIAFHDTQYYSLYDSSDLDGGFVITTSAQATDPESPYKFYMLNFVFVPSDEAQVLPSSNFTFPDEEILNIAVQYETSYARPKPTQTPSPQPIPPVCKRIYQSNQVYPFAINLNLNDLSYGPHGFPVTFDEDKEKIALYQPCGFSSCPIDFDCGEYTTASAWVCNRSLKCEGFSRPQVDFKMLHEDPDEGIRMQYVGLDDNIVVVDALCDFDLRPDYFYINSADMLNHSALHIRIHSNNACMQPLIQDVPTGCKAHLNDSTSQLDVDLTTYNTENGYRFDVKNEEFKEPHWIVYQPCGPMPCPEDSCPEATGATVWLCNNLSYDSNVCYDYGLFRNQINVESFMPKLDKGISVAYKGSNGRESHFRVQCNWSLPKGSITFSDNLDFYQGGISLYGYTSDVCIGPYPPPTKTPITPAPTTIPTRSPNPTPGGWSPPDPQPTAAPKPAGNLSSIVYLENATHSINMDLIQIKWSSYDIDISYDKQYSASQLYWQPFNSVTCPSGYNCQGTSSSDLWLCWGGKCWPMMDGKKNGISYTTHGGKLDGAYITTNGYYDTIFAASITCDKTQSSPYPRSTISFDGNNKYTVETLWDQACPRKEVTPQFPPEPTQPTPQPAPQPYPISYLDDSYGFDFSDLGQSSTQMVFQLQDTFEETFFLMDPDGLINCPFSSKCQGVEKATAWKCWNDPFTKAQSCLALADARYPPIKISYDNIKYDGGYGGYSLEAKLNCNPDSGDNNYTLSQVAIEDPDYHVTVNLYSSAFCVGRGLVRFPASGGAIFLLIIGFSIIGYVVIGTSYNFIINKTPSIPGENFIEEFFACVSTGFTYVTCQQNIITSSQAKDYISI